MALVADHWFAWSLPTLDRRPPWDAHDWEADLDWEWRSAAEDTPEQLFARWQETMDRSRSLFGAGAGRRRAGPTGPAQRYRRPGAQPPLNPRAQIEEYARHDGHAYLFRESVDGRTGE